MTRFHHSLTSNGLRRRKASSIQRSFTLFWMGVPGWGQRKQQTSVNARAPPWRLTMALSRAQTSATVEYSRLQRSVYQVKEYLAKNSWKKTDLQALEQMFRTFRFFYPHSNIFEGTASQEFWAFWDSLIPLKAFEFRMLQISSMPLISKWGLPQVVS